MMTIQKPKRTWQKKKDYMRKKTVRGLRRKGKRILQSFDIGTDDNIRKQIEKDFPSSKAFGTILPNYTIVADPTFTRDKTGAGEIEYFNEPEITYSNGYKKINPVKGPSLIYNPNSQTEEDIKLDLLHHYREYDPVYQDLLKDYTNTQDPGQILYNSELGEYFRNLPKEQQTDENWNKLVKENLNSQYMVQGIDGSLRGLMASDKLRSSGRYPSRTVYEHENLNTDAARKAYQNIVNYLTSERLPEVIVKPKKYKRGKDCFDMCTDDKPYLYYGTPEQLANPNTIWEYPEAKDGPVITLQGSYPSIQEYYLGKKWRGGASPFGTIQYMQDFLTDRDFARFANATRAYGNGEGISGFWNGLTDNPNYTGAMEDPGTAFLMKPARQAEFLNKLGYIEDARPIGRNMIKSPYEALYNYTGKYIPTYRKGQDDEQPENVESISDADIPEGISKQKSPEDSAERSLVHAGYYPTGYFKSKEGDKYYQMDIDLNDYGQHEASDAGGAKSAYKQDARSTIANLYDYFGNPFVQRSGLRKLAGKSSHDNGKDIHIKKANRGKFTEAANEHNMGVQEFARQVLSAPKGKYSSTLRKRANFARNFAH